MRVNKLLKISAMMAFLFSTSQPVFSKTDVQEAYDKYLSSYQNYQNAIVENKSSEEIKDALNSFEAAKNEYVNLVNTSKPANTELGSTAQSGANVGIENGIEANDLNSVGIPRTIKTQKQLALLSDIERETQGLYDALDKDAQGLIDELRDIQDKVRAEVIIDSLENKLAKVKDSSLSNFIKYEVATALDRLSLDDKKADKYLDELINTKDKRFVQLANLNKNYKSAKAKKKSWQYDLSRQCSEMNNTKESFKKASWLAFPVKLVRGVKSVVNNVKFTNNAGDYEDYMVEYEAIQAKFIHNVNSVFNEWQESIKEREDAGDVRLIYDNYDAWYARWNMINSANQTIDVQYFIIENDAFGLSLLGNLLRKAKEGVKVRLMVDTRGSNKLSILARGYLVELAKNQNVDVRVYNPITSNVVTLFTDVRKVESSNHDKIMIVDGERCITGGRNIADTYMVNEIDMDDAWRDCDIVVDSRNVCLQIKKAFDEEFNSMKSYNTDSSFVGMFTSGYSTKLLAAHACMDRYLMDGDFIKAEGDYKKASSTVKKVNKELEKYVHMNLYRNFNLLDDSYRCAVHVLDNNSLTGDRKDITENIVKYIDGSRAEIIIQNPYFAMTDRAEAALKRASKRGVPIYIHSNSERSSDSAPTEAIVLRDWKKMLTEMPTMRFFARDADGQLHGKTFNFDGKVAVVGSYNFDALSEKVNSEIACAIKSDDFCNELRARQMEDIEVAIEYKMAKDGQEEVAPDDTKGAKNKFITKVLSYTHFLDELF